MTIRTAQSAEAIARSRGEVREHAFEVVVVGGGLSGICAAIAAARNGARTALVHDRAMLGGNSSSETRLSPEFCNWFTPWAKETGIIEELYAEDRRRNHEPWVEATVNVNWDLTLYEAAKREEKLTLFLNSSVYEAIVSRNDVRTVVAVQLGSELRLRISGDFFVDATGTGMLGYLAGADFVWGREGQGAYDENLQPADADSQTMGSTMYYRARNVRRPTDYVPPSWAARYETEEALGPFRTHNWIDCGNYWHEVGFPHHAIYDNEVIRSEQARQVLGVWDHIKNHGDHRAGTYALEWIAWTPYRRENRRLLGDYVLTQHDVQGGTRHDDAVAFGAWPIDIHFPGGILNAPEPTLNLPLLGEGVNPYGIPFRSLYSRNVNNLLMAGRPISCSWIAFASTRVLPTGAVTGQAVGTAAALCVEHGVTPRELGQDHIGQLRELVIAQDGYIPFVRAELLPAGTTVEVHASGDSPVAFPAANSKDPLVAPAGQIFPVSSTSIDSIELEFDSSLAESVRVEIKLQRAASVWDPGEPDVLSRATVSVAPGVHWVTAKMDTVTEPGHYYMVSVEPVEGVSWTAFHDELLNPDVYQALTDAPDGDWYEVMSRLDAVASPVPLGSNAVERRDIATGMYFGGRRWCPTLALAGRYHPRSYSLRIVPEQRPYTADNVISGSTHPDDWTNAWVSAPLATGPQYIELAFSQPRDLRGVQITFDTDLNYMPELPMHVSPWCVKDYDISVHSNGGWTLAERIRGNYQRRRVHELHVDAPAEAVRIDVIATNGAETARIFEVRPLFD